MGRMGIRGPEPPLKKKTLLLLGLRGEDDRTVYSRTVSERQGKGRQGMGRPAFAG